MSREDDETLPGSPRSISTQRLHVRGLVLVWLGENPSRRVELSIGLAGDYEVQIRDEYGAKGTASLVDGGDFFQVALQAMGRMTRVPRS